MTISVFVGTSVDGFIARPNDNLDFLPEGGGEPHGYDEFMATVDALVIGRRTFRADREALHAPPLATTAKLDELLHTGMSSQSIGRRST